MNQRSVVLLALAGAFGTGCFGAGSMSGDEAPMVAAERVADTGFDWFAAVDMDEEADPAAMGPGRGGFGMAGGKATTSSAVVTGSMPRPRESKDKEGRGERQKGEDGNADEGGAEVRQWFPEAFLWSPLVETDASGTATLDVRVPDQLTTWRVLALAHSRAGAQAGTVHTFDSRLPLYVDPVVPGWLYTGDRIALPIQVVNTTAEPVDASLSVSSAGALTGQGMSTVSLSAHGSDVLRIDLAASGAGPSTVFATLGSADAAERAIPINPAGRPVQGVRGGTLSGSRAFTLRGPEGADPLTQELSVLVFPGPLAVLQSEVQRAGNGGAYPWDAAYGFALAAHVGELSSRAEAEADPDAIRRLRVLAWQRVVHHSRAPDAGTAADLLAAMRDVEGHELAEELRERLVRVVVDGQRADGTWARQSSAPLQQVIVQTAFAGRTLPDDQEGARIRTAGALERYAREVKDPYTAAVALASGLVEGSLQEHLREILLEGVVERGDGVMSVDVPSDALSPWGRRPAKAEMLAWVTLATLDDPEITWRGDLVAELMTGYDASWGFGAGPADVIALEAVLETLPGLDRAVDIVVSLDGEEVDRQSLEPSQPKVPALLTARPAAGNPEITLSVEPEVPGLAFVATLSSWVPWTGDEELPGVEVEADLGDLVVGRDTPLVLRLSAPSGVALTVEQGLPAGTSVDEASLATLSGLLTDHLVLQDRVRFTTRPFQAGEVIEVPLVVRPAFAGSFSTLPLSVRSSRDEPVYLAPVPWEIGLEGG